MNYTHYDYLDLAPGAPRDRVEVAYARVLERFNYGASGSQDLSGLVRMIHAAYAVLSDPDARRDYDAQLAREAAAADLELKDALDSRASVTSRRVQVPAALHCIYSAAAA